ncbi:MAG: hypothetical protein HY721_10550 [Planctomycetes bacterium]|nr:hypothetical protein [Planctomycetota bacterium]
MTSPRRGKTAAAIAGLATLAVLGGGLLLFWRDLAVRWHLGRLASNPGLLLEHATTPEGSVRREAARAFARTPAGAEALLGVVVRESWKVSTYLDKVVKQSRGPDPARVGGSCAIVSWPPPVRAGYCSFWFGEGLLVSAGPLLLVLDHPVEPPGLNEVQSLLAEVADRDVLLPEYPGLRFTLLPLEEARQRFQDLRGSVTWLDIDEPPFVCLIRRAASAAL